MVLVLTSGVQILYDQYNIGIKSWTDIQDIDEACVLSVASPNDNVIAR